MLEQILGRCFDKKQMVHAGFQISRLGATASTVLTVEGHSCRYTTSSAGPRVRASKHFIAPLPAAAL